MDGIDANSDKSPRYHYFNQFVESVDLVQIGDNFRKLCHEIGINPDSCESVYTSLKRELTNWKCRDIWNVLDKRAGLSEYGSQTACKGMSVLIVGAGPVGLRAAIESALLGAQVDLVEKRTSFSRNNVLHLWPFLIADLTNLGAKKFHGKFCTGSINHISIRVLQAFLLKICLLFGVKVHTGVLFTGLVEPTDMQHGWSIQCTPQPSILLGTYNAIIAADGKQKSLPGFHFNQFRAQLALAITVNFVNRNTQQENTTDEISGVSFVYNQEFFKNLSEKHGIELENIVYYKDETHYLVMTAKKSSLLKKAVIKQDQSDPRQLLSAANVDRKALEEYAVEAATFATHGSLGELTFAVNHLGEHDVALFDFTSLFAAENASRIIEKKGKRLLLLIAGDSLLEPFWPTGSGCARGFLGALDAAWALKRFASGRPPIEILQEREAIYYLLPQTTPDRLHKDIVGYTIDPKSRYPNLNEAVPPQDISSLYETDNTEMATSIPESLTPHCGTGSGTTHIGMTHSPVHTLVTCNKPASEGTAQSLLSPPSAPPRPSPPSEGKKGTPIGQLPASILKSVKETLPDMTVTMETPPQHVRERIRQYQLNDSVGDDGVEAEKSTTGKCKTDSSSEVKLPAAKRSKQKVKLSKPSPAKKSKQRMSLFHQLQGIFHHKRPHATQEREPKHPKTDQMEDMQTHTIPEQSKGKQTHVIQEEPVGLVCIADIKERLKRGGVATDD